MQNWGPYITGAAFWLFVGVCAVLGIAVDYKRRRVGMDVVRAAIEKGQQLDPALIEKLTSSQHGRDEPVDPTLLKLGGVITLATGIGLCPVAWLVGIAYPVVTYPLLGLGVLAIFVGIGLLIGGRIVARAAERRGTPSVTP
jgi:hypothetical protein